MKNVIKEAVNYLYDMDDFILSVTDNELWLSYGVPDGEFEEQTKEELRGTYDDHSWLICDFEGKFDINLFIEFFDCFKISTNNSDYDKSERKLLIDKIDRFIKGVK